MATFGFALLVRDVLFFTPWMFGERRDSVLEAPRPSLGGLNLDTDVGYYYVVLVIAVAAVLLAYAVSRGRLGRLLRAMADAPAAVNAHGANTNVTKFLVFCVSAFLAGIGGAILTPISGSINVAVVPPDRVAGAGGRAVHRRQPPDPGGRPSPPRCTCCCPATSPAGTIQPYIPISFGALAIIASVLVGRSILRRTADRIAESTRARERVAHHPVEARLPRGWANWRRFGMKTLTTGPARLDVEGIVELAEAP